MRRVLVLVGLLALVGCGDDDDDTSNDLPPAQNTNRVSTPGFLSEGATWFDAPDPKTGRMFRCLKGYEGGTDDGGPFIWCYEVQR